MHLRELAHHAVHLDALLLGKLDAVARQPVELQAELPPEDIARYVTDQLVIERETA